MSDDDKDNGDRTAATIVFVLLAIFLTWWVVDAQDKPSPPPGIEQGPTDCVPAVPGDC